jgi:peroxiredoxin
MEVHVMRNRKTLFAAALLLATVAAAPAFAAATVGEAAPGFQLKDLKGKTHSLADYKGKVVVLEWLNPNCPVSDRHAREKTMTDLVKQHGQVVWLGINSTNKEHRDFLQAAEHQAWAKKNGIEYTILYDETGKTGKAYDAKTTPHMFIIDKQGRLAYNGAIDDDPSGRKAKAERANYVGGGLNAQKAGKSPDPATTKPYGCSVKY